MDMYLYDIYFLYERNIVAQGCIVLSVLDSALIFVPLCGSSSKVMITETHG